MVVTETRYMYPPDEYLRTCHPAFDSNTMQDVIVGMNAAIGRCNSRIRAIVSWKEELQNKYGDSSVDDVETETDEQE